MPYRSNAVILSSLRSGLSLNRHFSCVKIVKFPSSCLSFESFAKVSSPAGFKLKAQEKKAALRKIPEQAMLAEVRRMVGEMQTLNQRLEETEAAIEEYFKPIDKEAQIIMNMQLEGEEKTMRTMMKAMQEQALLEKAAAEKLAEASASNASHQNQGTASIPAAATTPTADSSRLNS